VPGKRHAQFTTIGSILAIVAICGCADILDVPSDPQFVSSGPFRCLDVPPPAPKPDKETATVQVQACNFVSTNCSAPVTGLTAQLCNKRDVNCSTPIQSDIRDNNGTFTVEVNTGGPLGAGFDGYLKIKSADDLCTNAEVFGPAAPALCAFAPLCDQKMVDDKCKMPVFAPSMVFFNPPIVDDARQPILLPLVPTAAVQPILQAAGGVFDPSTGFIFITALDCDGLPVPGVNYDISKDDTNITELYIDSGVVTKAAMQTDASGLGGFLGVSAGFAEVVGFTGAEPMRRRIGGIGVQVAPFTISYSALVPQP
jgi:hypothetical protein